MTDLPALLARLEGLTGPDRETDARIAVATFVRKHDEWGEFAEMPLRDDCCTPGTYWLCSRSGMSLQTAMHFTSTPQNINASIALIRALIAKEAKNG